MNNQEAGITTAIDSFYVPERMEKKQIRLYMNHKMADRIMKNTVM
jgi:hypothetical protein